MVRIEVPQLSAFYEDNLIRHVALLHAPVSCKVVETVVASAVEKVLDRPMTNVVVHCSETSGSLAHFKVKTSFKFADLKRVVVTQSLVAYRNETNGSILFVSTGDAASDVVHYVFGLGCHLQKRDLVKVYPNALRVKLAGTLADPGHWFHEFCLHASVHRFGWDEILRRWPQLEGEGLRKDDPYYRRHMFLEDVAPNFDTRFVKFARTRLYIRTDKPLSNLSDRQRLAASGQHGTPIVPLEVTRLQKRYLAIQRKTIAEGKKPWFILVKYRRGGFTTIEQAKSYKKVVSQPNSQCVTFAHVLDSTKRIFRMVSTMYEHDPNAPALVGESKSELEFPNGSLFFIGTAGGAGFRGDTLQRVHGSEVAKWCLGPHQLERVDELAGGFLGAASNGEVVLESTPNGREWFYQTYQEAKRGQNKFTPLFLPWYSDPNNRLSSFNHEELRDTLASDESFLVERRGLDLGQVAWRREQQKIYKRLFVQEMPEDDETCFLTSGTCFFDVDICLAWLESLQGQEVDLVEHRGGYEKRWRSPQPKHEYVIGVDTSEGLPGGDLNGCGVLDRRTGEQVAALHGHFSPTELAEHVARMHVDYNGALVGIERENHGHAVLQRIMQLGISKPHFRGGPLYYFCPAANHRGQGHTMKNSRPGWSTNSVTRPVMLDDLAEALDDGGLAVRDTDFVDECLSFRRQQNGKFAADGAAHDDCVMKWSIALQMSKLPKFRGRITLLDVPRNGRTEETDDGADEPYGGAKITVGSNGRNGK